ncbi:MAG: anti-sigma factor [Rubrivivax sp.]|nr:anti-sigma factor [Rubrivivax sp.]
MSPFPPSPPTIPPPGPPGGVFSDEQLSAWVDGEGSAVERADVQAWLRAHPEQARRIEAWAADRSALHAAYVRVVQEPVPAHLAEVALRPLTDPSAPAAAAAAAAAARPAWLGGWLGSRFGPEGDGSRATTVLGRLSPMAAAAAAAGLFVMGAIVGGALSWQWKERQSIAQARLAPGPSSVTQGLPAAGREAWLQRAAFAHSVYTIEPRHAVEVRAQEEHLARWLTRRIEAPVKLFDLREQGFELVGGRLLPDGPGKSAQLMYQDGGGRRITVYLRKPEAGSDTAFRYERQGKLGMFYWIDEKCGFALVGELPKEHLLALAKAIYDQDAVLPPPSLAPPSSSAAGASAPPSGK